MSLLLNRVQQNTSTMGTGTLDLGTAVVPFQSFIAAGAVSGQKYSYLITEGNDWEIGDGVFTDGTPDTLTRTLVESSTGALLNLGGSAVVSCVSQVGTGDYEVLDVWDHAVDGNTAEVFSPDLTGFRRLKIIMEGSTASSIGWRGVTVSVNGGSSYYTGTSYKDIDGAGVVTGEAQIYFHGTSSTGSRGGTIELDLLPDGAPKAFSCPNRSSGPAGYFNDSLSPINKVAVANRNASAVVQGNLTSGKIWFLAK